MQTKLEELFPFASGLFLSILFFFFFSPVFLLQLCSIMHYIMLNTRGHSVMESINLACQIMGTSSCGVVASEMVSSEVSSDVRSICYGTVMMVSPFAVCSVGIHVKGITFQGKALLYLAASIKF